MPEVGDVAASRDRRFIESALEWLFLVAAGLVLLKVWDTAAPRTVEVEEEPELVEEDSSFSPKNPSRLAACPCSALLWEVMPSWAGALAP